MSDDKKTFVIVVNRGNMHLLNTPEAQAKRLEDRKRVEKMLKLIKEMERIKWRPPVIFRVVAV